MNLFGVVVRRFFPKSTHGSFWQRVVADPRLFIRYGHILTCNSDHFSTHYVLVRSFRSTGRPYSMAQGKLDCVPDVDIEHGRFKYILIKIYDNSTGEEQSKVIVRGYNWAAYHADIYENVDAKLQGLGLESECIGGGRILHDLDKKSIQVYGYSQGFGKADHAVTTEILKKNYPGYQSISWSNEGY